jgi:hypothetical protein
MRLDNNNNNNKTTTTMVVFVFLIKHMDVSIYHDISMHYKNL